ncbi:MAG: hypothetical protein JKY88_15720 [Pseudomonadales bacterium]|nr:hypothetical protein [Pseudomonadales bacterium]
MDLNFITPGNSRLVTINITRDVTTGSDHERLLMAKNDFTKCTAWNVKPEGFCQGDICIPAGEAVTTDGRIDLAAFANLTGRPLITNFEEKAISLGESSSARSSELASLKAPDFSLPDLSGKMHSLSEHRGKKILLAAYASW